MTENPSLSEKLTALYRVAQFRPTFTIGILLLSLFAAGLEGLGLSFLLPIVKIARGNADPESADGILEAFISVYDFVGFPFTLEFVVLGVGVVMTLRYTSSFLVDWLRTALQEQYVQSLQTEAFEKALAAEVAYFDEQGSDDILNAIVTQAGYTGSIIKQIVKLLEQGLLSLMYLSIAVYLAPMLTIAAGVILGSITFLLRNVIESGFSVGDRVANANEQVQESVQAGMQGIRDVKLFGMDKELFRHFDDAIQEAVSSKIVLNRNQAALTNFYQLATAITVFGLIYAALTFSSMSLAGLGVFLFAMFRLAPRVGNLNNMVYSIEGNLPHLTRTWDFIEELEARSEPQTGTAPVPDGIDRVTLDDVGFAYETGEQIFDGLSLSFETGEFVALVGPSGAGKSTIVSLLTRMYEPDRGEIRLDGTPIREFDIREWRSRVSVVRQHPFIFNDTLRRNVTIGNRHAPQSEVERVCEIAQVTEFFEDLPDGYDTVLGDDGVRLSGGQKQRVALARALLKDADLLVLDEATSDLDSNIEETVHQAIESMERDYAMLVIAHRLSTVVNADCIYTIEDGRIEESGLHGELIEQDGTYAELYATQTEAR
jgi:subfamily B ATP-binding cassette protein MsbA